MSDSFIFEFLIATSPQNERILCVRLEAGRNLYNGCLHEILKRLVLARKSPDWQKAVSLPRGKERSGLFRKALKDYRFSEYELHAFVKKLVKECWIKDHIDSQVAQKIASRAFQSADEYAKNKKGKPRFKGKGQFSSIEGKSNITGIRFKEGKIHWNDLILNLIYDKKDKNGVEAHALLQCTKYVRLVRRIVRKKVCYYAQLVQEGKPLIKKKQTIGKGKTVGLDIGPSTIAIVSEEKAILRTLTDIDENQKVIKLLQRKLDRSRRKTNPSNFDKKGRPLKQKNWNRSKKYLEIQATLAEEKRKSAQKRKTGHGTLANQIISMGCEIKTEDLSYKSYQKNYGKSVNRHAPGTLMQTLRLKAANAGGQVIEFSTYQTKLSQTCHNCDVIKKKSLKERWHICSCGLTPVQRDLYTAFLANHVHEGNLNRTQAKEAWASAGPLLEQALLRCKETAKGKRKQASFGI